MKNNDQKKIGVWLDHAKAHFIDISQGPANIETAFSVNESNQRFKGETGAGTQLGNNRSSNNEHHQHNRQQELTDEYYKLLADRLNNYDEILLLGSGTAKNELFNRLQADKHFTSKSIHVKPAEELTENQMVAQVRDHFNL